MQTSTNQPIASIPERFAQIAARYAPRIAISTFDTKWTYAELDQCSNALAAHVLDRLGATSEPVALLMQHGALLMAAILGTLKAGKIYLALDSGNPKERLASMLADARARLLLTDKSNAALANSLASGRLQVLEVADGATVTSTSQTLPEVSPEAGAWLMYTSGSTGAPKGVWQNHRGVVCRTDVYGELIQLTADDRLSLLASCSLATSATPLFGALLNGATLCPFNVRSRGIERLADWLRRERVSVYHSVPTVFRHLAWLAGDKCFFEGLRLIRLDGEPMLRGDVEIYRQHAPANCLLMHALSSTETGLISALMIARQTVLPDRRVPVGQPVRGVEVSLLNEQNQSVKAGDQGLIAVSSAQLAQGYWLRPEATMEKFRADDRDPRTRIFVTADLGRFLPDGNLEHLGRADQLVKIRGLQVDLGKVEAALQALKFVQEAVVVAREDSSGERRLAAYVVLHPKANVPPQTYRRELRAQLLPEHMIPDDFVTLAQLPQTPGGKVDRLALPSPPRETRAAPGRGQKPRDFIEGGLARIWQSVLGISQVGRHDDFFDLGGTSLQSVEVLLHIEEAFGTSLPPSILTEHSTVEKLAAVIAGHVVILSPSPLVLLRDAKGGRPLFLIHSGQGDVASYGLLVRRLPGRPIYGLQSVGLQGEAWPLMSIQAMAQRYLREIVAKDPIGPYLLGATCMGGMVAFEIAQMLVRQNRKVGLLALFDVPYPLPKWRHHEWIERWYGPIRDPARDAFRMLRWFFVRGVVRGHNPRSLAAYRRFVAHMNSRANRSYQPEFYAGAATLFVTVEKKYPREDLRLLMRRYLQESKVITLPGDRSGLFNQPAVDELARQLEICLELTESPGPVTTPANEPLQQL